jgi:hypothetical protein
VAAGWGRALTVSTSAGSRLGPFLGVLGGTAINVGASRSSMPSGFGATKPPRGVVAGSDTAGGVRLGGTVSCRKRGSTRGFSARMSSARRPSGSWWRPKCDGSNGCSSSLGGSATGGSPEREGCLVAIRMGVPNRRRSVSTWVEQLLTVRLPVCVVLTGVRGHLRPGLSWREVPRRLFQAPLQRVAPALGPQQPPRRSERFRR